MKWKAPWMTDRDRSHLPDALREVSRSLAALSEATERDFLAVGEKLQTIQTDIRQETESMGNLLDEIGGERDRHLAQAFGEVAQWASQAGDAVDCRELLAALGPVARAVNAPVLELQTSLRSLKVMNIMTRIESARLGTEAGGFEALAVRADDMAGGIGRKSADILGTVEELTSLLDRSGDAVGAMSQLQQAELVRLAAECSAGLQELRQAHAHAAEVAGGARAACREVAGGIGDLVMALQCHDSTRQRLEHIQSALEEVAAGTCAGESHAIGLQASQLEEASQAFLNEIGRITGALERLAAKAVGVSHMAREFAGTEGENSAARVELRFAEAGGQVERWISARRAMAEAVGKVERKCAQMAGFVSEIEAAGAQMLWVALNAEIQAARLSGSGAVMEAVAQGIRRVAQSACAGAAGAGEALRAVEAAAGRLSAALGADAGQDAVRAGDVAGRIDRMVSQLTASGAEHRRLLASMAQGCDRMSEEIGALRQSIQADRLMAETSDACQASLKNLAAQSGGPDPARDGQGHMLWLHRAHKKYAMHAEREVHAAFAARFAAQTAPATSGARHAPMPVGPTKHVARFAVPPHVTTGAAVRLAAAPQQPIAAPFPYPPAAALPGSHAILSLQTPWPNPARFAGPPDGSDATAVRLAAAPQQPIAAPFPGPPDTAPPEPTVDAAEPFPPPEPEWGDNVELF